MMPSRDSIRKIIENSGYRPLSQDLAGYFQGKDCTIIPKELCGKLPTCKTCDLYLMKEEYKNKQKAPKPFEIQFALLKSKSHSNK